MSGLDDRARGAGREAKGKLQEGAGRAAGDPELRAKGETEQAKGKGQSFLGRVKMFIARR